MTSCFGPSVSPPSANNLIFLKNFLCRNKNETMDSTSRLSETIEYITRIREDHGSLEIVRKNLSIIVREEIRKASPTVTSRKKKKVTSMITRRMDFFLANYETKKQVLVSPT